MNKKILFWAIGIMVIVSGFSFTENAIAVTPRLSLDHSPINPQVNQNVSFYLHVKTYNSDGCGHALIGVSPPPWNTLIINFGDGSSEEWGCVPQHVAFRVYGCRATAEHSYSQPGSYTVSTRARYSWDNPGCDEWIEVTDTIIIVEADCEPDGCNANCPVLCTVAEDPDCGCLNGDGCCGIGCNAKNDNDCLVDGPVPAGMATSYDNPLLAENVPQFLWQMMRYFFQVFLYYLAPLLILIGAYVIITSGGSASKMALGRKIVVWTLIGCAFILLAKGLIRLIFMFLEK